MRARGLVALLVLAVLGGSTFAHADATAYPGKNGSLLFLRDLGGNAAPGSHIFVAAPDGSVLRDVTPAGFVDIRGASWSPDGTRIAFSGLHVNRNGVAVYLINADGSGLRQVTRGDHRDAVPTWSPDGKSLAFTSFDRGLLQIFRSRLDGSGRKVLSNQQTNCGGAKWSPAGSFIVFECELPGGLVIMRADGSRERRLTSRPEGRTDYWPVWAPDGGTILFTRGAWTYRIRPDGSGVARSVRAAGTRAVSPDGKWMAVSRLVDEQQDVWVMRRDGREARRITATVGISEYGPDWQPVR